MITLADLISENDRTPTHEYLEQFGPKISTQYGRNVTNVPIAYVLSSVEKAKMGRYEEFHGFVPDFLLTTEFEASAYIVTLGIPISTLGTFSGDAHFHTVDRRNDAHVFRFSERPKGGNKGEYQLRQQNLYILTPEQYDTIFSTANTIEDLQKRAS